MDLATQIEDQIRTLPTKRRRVVIHGLNEFARELLQQSASAQELRKIESASRAAIALVELLMTGSSQQLARVAEMLAELRAESDSEGAQVAELEAHGRLQVLALYREVEEASLTVAELEAAGIQRQRLKQLRDERRLLGIRLPFQRGFLYPRWQFGSDLRPKPYLATILEVADGEGIDAISVHRLLIGQAPGEDATLLELCEQGRLDPILNALRELGG